MDPLPFRGPADGLVCFDKRSHRKFAIGSASWHIDASNARCRLLRRYCARAQLRCCRRLLVAAALRRRQLPACCLRYAARTVARRQAFGSSGSVVSAATFRRTVRSRVCVAVCVWCATPLYHNHRISKEAIELEMRESRQRVFQEAGQPAGATILGDRAIDANVP